MIGGNQVASATSTTSDGDGFGLADLVHRAYFG